MLRAEAQHRNKKRIKDESNEDRISQLTDPILHHILSLLLTKDAAVTIVLSKRWKSLWESIPTLDFGKPKPALTLGAPQPPPSPVPKLLMNFVDSIFHIRQDNSSIVRFRFYCDQHCDSSRVYLWISKVIRYKIQQLVIAFHPSHRDIVFPHSLFTCETVTVLKLETNSVLKFPHTTTNLIFPNLKFLSFKHVTFSDYYSTQQLFSNLPVLEELAINNCNWVGINVIKISSLKLKKVLLCDTCSLKNGLATSKINIFVPNMTDIFFWGDLPKSFDLCNVPLLARAFIRVNIGREIFEKRDFKVHHLGTKFLAPLSNVQELTISGDVVEAVFGGESLLAQLPTFNKLISLRLKWSHHHLANRTLLNFLQAMPNLENLLIDQASCKDGNVDCPRQTTRHRSLSIHLKSIEIGKIGGYQCELGTIELLLKNARVLEKLIIRACSDITIKKKHEISKWLEKISIHSERCRTSFL